MNLDRIKNLTVPHQVVRYSKRDTILYALALGYGEDPCDEDELGFVYEGAGFEAVPAMANILAHPGFWAQQPEYEIEWVKILHAEQALKIHKQLPAECEIRGEYSVAAVEDKGAERGALLHQVKNLYEQSTNDLVATVRSTLFLRGDGGQGGFGDAPDTPAPMPERSPDRHVEIRTSKNQALIYRLNGDWNPLHADPVIARKAGFAAPILQGLCTMGVACRAILKEYCGNDPARLGEMFVRFSSPVMPGDAVRFEFFDEKDEMVRFRAQAPARNVTVLDRCYAVLK